MLVEFNKEYFYELMDHPELQLPLTWDGVRFLRQLENHLMNYKTQVRPLLNISDYNKLDDICTFLVKVVQNYHEGIPSTAFLLFQ